MENRYQVALTLLDSAFVGTQRDDYFTLHQAQLADQSMSREISREEWDAEKLRDPETDWRDVPANSLDECPAALSHASPQSWLFYLPAYMRYALELLAADALEEADLPSSVIFHLTYNDKPPLQGYVLDRFEQLTPSQEHAVVAFLECFRDHSRPWLSKSADEALSTYWALPADKRVRPRIIIP